LYEAIVLAQRMSENKGDGVASLQKTFLLMTDAESFRGRKMRWAKKAYRRPRFIGSSPNAPTKHAM
jgi:hypothetical protein